MTDGGSVVVELGAADTRPALAALILCGGAGVRMGQDKATQLWDGRRAIDRVADLAAVIGAQPILTVGEPDYGYARVHEDPAGSGPVAGILAGAAALAAYGCSTVIVLAVDAPTMTAEDLWPLLAAGGAGACYAGLNLPFVARLEKLPKEAPGGWPIGRLIDQAGLTRLPCPTDSQARIRGANTPAERDALIVRPPS